MSATLDIQHLRSWIGRTDVAADLISEDLARKYHATFDLAGEPPRYGDAVPPLIHFCLAQPAAPTDELGVDGHPARGGFLPPVPLPRRMSAGGQLTFHGALKVGDRAVRTSHIEDVVLKEGRTGPLCFVTVQHGIEANGKLMISERQDIVYRGLDAPRGGPKTLARLEPGQHRRPMQIDTRLLFRYSALTFNGHRIHYDRLYATEREGYPGLVVHGPLQAALLCYYATELHGVPPRYFSFRGLSPLCDGDAVTLHASETADGLSLWTAKQGEIACMSAEARWQ